MARAILVQTGGQPDTDELTAVTGDVAKGKTAYVNGYDDPIAGTLELTGNASDAKVRSGYTYYSNDLKTKHTGTLDIPAGKIIAKQTIDGVAGTATNDANLPANRVISGFHGWAKGDHIRGTLTVTSVINFNMSAYSTSQVVANWQNPTSGLFGGVQIVSRTDGRYPNNPWDGDNRYKGTGNNTSGGGWSSTTIGGLSAGQGYWFSIFSYCNTSDGQWWSGSYNKRNYYCAPTSHGSRTFTSSTTFTVPSNVRTIDVFCVGGGGGTGISAPRNGPYQPNGGGGGGYTSTSKGVKVSPGQQIAVVVGAGGGWFPASTGVRPSSIFVSRNGGSSSFGSICSAAGGENGNNSGQYHGPGGAGGSGGGCGGHLGGWGGSDGANGHNAFTASNDTCDHSPPGQGRTTRAFGEGGGTLYSSGGYGGGDRPGRDAPADGAANTGNGAKGGDGFNYGSVGGSGIVIVRW